MRATTIDKVKQGELFRLSNSESAPVWVRGYYYRPDKEYEAYKYEDTCHENFFKKGRKVWVDFEY